MFFLILFPWVHVSYSQQIIPSQRRSCEARFLCPFVPKLVEFDISLTEISCSPAADNETCEALSGVRDFHILLGKQWHVSPACLSHPGWRHWATAESGIRLGLGRTKLFKNSWCRATPDLLYFLQNHWNQDLVEAIVILSLQNLIFICHFKIKFNFALWELAVSYWMT